MPHRDFANTRVDSGVEVATQRTFVDYGDKDKMDLQSQNQAKKFIG